MKWLVLFVGVIWGCLQVEGGKGIPYLTSEEKQCVEEQKLNETTILELYVGGALTVEDNVQLNHFIYCIWLKYGFQYPNGTINYEELKKSYPLARKVEEDNYERLQRMPELLFNAVAVCEENPPCPGGSHGQKAAEVQNCIVKNYLKVTTELNSQK